MSAEKKDKEIASMEKLVSLCKRRGFIFQSSEIYGGIGGFWDYGPLGSELKRNLRDTWWKTMTREREDVVGLDATIIMHPNIWKASGHVDTFSDPMSDCLLTKKRFRADHVDLQSGMVYHFTGATGEEGTKSDVPFAVLTPFGKPRESALKVAKLFYEQGNLVVCTFISPFRADRAFARSIMPQGAFHEIFVKCDLEVCRRRDPKGLYRKAEAGEIPEFTGVSSPYEAPEQPELVLETDLHAVEDLVATVRTYLRERGVAG